MKLPRSFYERDDVITISRELIGKYVFTNIDGEVTGGYIVETEAYNGIIDRASHAYGNRNTPRTKGMYEAGGIAYDHLRNLRLRNSGKVFGAFLFSSYSS